MIHVPFCVFFTQIWVLGVLHYTHVLNNSVVWTKMSPVLKPWNSWNYEVICVVPVGKKISIVQVPRRSLCHVHDVTCWSVTQVSNLLPEVQLLNTWNSWKYEGIYVMQVRKKQEQFEGFQGLLYFGQNSRTKISLVIHSLKSCRVAEVCGKCRRLLYEF